MILDVFSLSGTQGFCMKLLALETANEQCSVSIVDETQELFFQLDARAKAQTQTILPLTEQALLQTQTQLADLAAIALVVGQVHLVVYVLMLRLLKLWHGHKICLLFLYQACKR